MDSKWRYLTTGLISGLCLGLFAISTYLLLFVVKITEISFTFSDSLLLIETVVLSITLVFLVVQIGFQGDEIDEEAKSRQIDSLTQMFGSLDTDEASMNRKFVFTKLPDVTKASEEDWRVASKVWVSLDHVGLLVEYGLINEELVMEMYVETIIRCWIKLRAYVILERQKRGELGRRYQKYFELLAKKAEKYYIKHFDPHYSEDKVKFHD